MQFTGDERVLFRSWRGHVWNVARHHKSCPMLWVRDYPTTTQLPGKASKSPLLAEHSWPTVFSFNLTFFPFVLADQTWIYHPGIRISDAVLSSWSLGLHDGRGKAMVWGNCIPSSTSFFGESLTAAQIGSWAHPPQILAVQCPASYSCFIIPCCANFGAHCEFTSCKLMTVMINKIVAMSQKRLGLFQRFSCVQTCHFENSGFSLSEDFKHFNELDDYKFPNTADCSLQIFFLIFLTCMIKKIPLNILQILERNHRHTPVWPIISMIALVHISRSFSVEVPIDSRSCVTNRRNISENTVLDFPWRSFFCVEQDNWSFTEALYKLETFDPNIPDCVPQMWYIWEELHDAAFSCNIKWQIWHDNFAGHLSLNNIFPIAQFKFYNQYFWRASNVTLISGKIEQKQKQKHFWVSKLYSDVYTWTSLHILMI